ncbi:hypothetical protein [Paenibacillus sp. NFR01]|uniref:hypothetical protein n=1 Tax=Paenibacillus sp. NFR01 TaxID=1566279 RepID=UPI0011143707|nr:hypothetical protein [Paenibacillus sp. NFR01]
METVLVILIAVFTLMIFLIVQSIMPMNLGVLQKVILAILEFLISVAISYAVNKYFLITYPEHYEAQFLEGLLSAMISVICLPLYALIFFSINKLLKKIRVSRILFSLLIILVGIGLQAGAIYILDKPYIVDTQGW